MSTPRHPNAHIRAAVAEALALGWRVEKASGSAHAWGILYCPGATRGACVLPVYGTPRVPENEARRIGRRFDARPHTP